MGFACGIVGLPNVGKSTLFNALTHLNIGASNYPFCTIKPNHKQVPVYDARLYRLADIVKPEKITPAMMQFTDIAGLVQGASEGQGLGNQFLGHIRNVDAICHVLRCFEDANVIHVEDRVNPPADKELIELELMLADLQTVERALAKTRKQAKAGAAAKEATAVAAVLESLHHGLNHGMAVRDIKTGTEDGNDLVRNLGRSLGLLTAKPQMLVLNCSESQIGDRAWIEDMEQRFASTDLVVLPVCASLEAELAAFSAEERIHLLKDYGLEDSGLNRLIRTGQALLQRHDFFTAGAKEVRAWTIANHATAIEAAAVIHQDFQRLFIRAEVVAFEDFVACNGAQGARIQGKMHIEGRDYRVQDGDVMFFRVGRDGH